jgi:hypothetical protein
MKKRKPDLQERLEQLEKRVLVLEYELLSRNYKSYSLTIPGSGNRHYTLLT